MSERQPTRAELVARIQASSKDAVVRAEMQRMGFWPADQDQPSVEASLIQREQELVKALQALHQELQEKGDPQAALRAMRKARMQAALERREATAQAREQRRHERAMRWHQSRDQQALYLGQGVSAGLQPQAGAMRLDRLQKNGLPALDSPAALAQAMGMPLRELKFLCFHREVADTHHYRQFSIPKKTGGERHISAPMPRLKRAQYWVLDQLLCRVPLHPAAHGFVPGRSIVSNAQPHCRSAVLVNMDLKDFFPTVAFPRIKGVFVGLGYGEDVATMLALLCSENRCDELEVDGVRVFVGGKSRERVLPQGAPTSPMLTNVLCRRLDRRLQGLAEKLGFHYTRYADDLSFSAQQPGAQEQTGQLLRRARYIVQDEGFVPHPDKQGVMRTGRRQEVTGVVVNSDAPSVSRESRRRLRAALHRATRQGMEQVTWNGQAASAATLQGYARFVSMVSPSAGQRLLAQSLALPALAETTRPQSQSAVSRSTFRKQAAKGQTPERIGAAWWQIAPRPEPVLQATAGQLQAARRAKLDAAREARQPSKSAGSTPPARGGFADASRRWQPAASGDLSSAEQAPGSQHVPWASFLAQCLLLGGVATKSGSVTILTLGCLWLGWRLKNRRFAWSGYLLGLFAIFFSVTFLSLWLLP